MKRGVAAVAVLMALLVAALPSRAGHHPVAPVHKQGQQPAAPPLAKADQEPAAADSNQPVKIDLAAVGAAMARGEPSTSSSQGPGSRSASDTSRDSYVSWLGLQATKSPATTQSGKKSDSLAPRYRLSGVYYEPVDVVNQAKYKEIDVLEQGGTSTDRREKTQEQSFTVKSRDGSSRSVKIKQTKVNEIAFKVTTTGTIATIEWTDKFVQPWADKKTEYDEPVTYTSTAVSTNKVTIPAEFALGDPLTLVYELTTSVRKEPEEKDPPKILELEPAFDGYGYAFPVEMGTLRFLVDPPRESVTIKLEFKLTPTITEKGIQYQIKVTGDEALAMMQPESKARIAKFEKLEANRVFNLNYIVPPWLQIAVHGDGVWVANSVPRIRWTLDRDRRCDPLPLEQLSGGSSTLGGVAGGHKQMATDLAQILARTAPKQNQGEGKEEYNKRVLEFNLQREKDAIAKDAEMRLLERRWFERLPDEYGSLPDATTAAIRRSLSEHCNCLAKITTQTLGDVRSSVFRFVEDSGYMRARRQYDRNFKDLQHVLAVWGNVNKLDVLRLEMLIDQHRRAQAEGDPQFKPAALESLQLDLKNVYVDEGWINTLREQATGQDALDGRDSYGQALTAQRTASQKQPWHDEFIKRSAQRAMYGMQYAINVFGVLWTGFVDSVARLINQTAVANWVDTMSEATDKQIKEVQKKSQERLSALVALRRFEAAETRAMGQWLAGGDTPPVDAARLQALDDNRQFHEATSGGLMRMAACLENDYDAMLDKEYRTALKHGQLALAEMRQAVNLKEGREAGGKDPLLKRMLDPLGTWKTACTQLRGSYDTMEDYLAERDGQLREMDGLRPRMLKMHWDLEYLERNLPENAKLHASLADRNPDYMAFLEKHRTLWLKKQQEVLYAEASKEDDAEERARLRHKASVLQVLAPQDAQVSMPPILKQQLLDRVAVLDYEGAVAVARELETFDPQGAKGLSAWLANDLSWEYAKDLGISSWVSLGNGGIYTAFFTRYFSPAAVRNAPVSLSNVKAIFTSWNGFAEFLNFTWGRVNPFSSLTTSELTPAKLGWATATLVKVAAETVEQDAIKKALLVGQFGMDDAYADFLAQTLLNMQQMQTDDPRSLFGTTCRNLTRRLDAWIPAQIDVPNWKKTTTARAMLREYWQAVEARIELEKAMDGMRKASGDPLGLTAITQAIAHAKLKLKLLLSPVTADTIRAALDDYDAAIKGQPPLGRLTAQTELFKAVPMPVMLKAKKDKKLTPSLEARLDAARRDILQTMQTQFLLQNPALAPFVERFVYTGSGARPDWPEYKRLSSDLDFTIVLKEGTALENRLKVKSTFDEFFRSRTNFSPEEFDINCFADERPRLSSQGMTVDGLLELVQDQDQAKRIVEEISRNNESFLRDLNDPERYLSTGALRFLHYLNMLGGKVKKAEGPDLVDDDGYQKALYQDVKFESWMGIEMVMDNVKMIGAHSGNRLDYAKALAKYGLRVLLARVIQSDRGLKMANELTVEDITVRMPETGGIHGEFVRMAEQLGGRFTPEQLRLFREMNLRKQGRPWGEVLEERLGRQIAENDPQINAVIETHIAEMEGFVKQSLAECAITNATHMKRLATAIEQTQEPNAKQALTLKYRELVYSVSEVWNSLGDAERKTVLSSAPAEADMFKALEDMRSAMKRRDTEFIKNYQPFVK